MTQALYRRYRPVTFAEVIGQAHVTGPLQQALRHDRTHHAYLFSGPRGCGKTTSARIMARCLNCEQGPTPDPCGVCESCVGLAPGGGGSLDVIELDAATHGLVDDARDLRERAFYHPSSSRFKVYIIDEAHMLGPGAANALLKIVEEPPPHVKFVFATTEPDKLIATIRSRVHHYPFRLVPPGELATYLATLLDKEGLTADRGAVAMVVRAGRGSVRDSLSILDQLVSGAPDGGITYDYAAGLLGLTDAALLDDTIEAFAAGDGASVFQIVDRVVESGHDPRRFAEDLLERLRDLIVLHAVPDAAAAILGEHPADELDRMRQQAANFGAAELSRAADIVNAGLTEMRGATAPRLQLELICARVLLPAAEDGPRGLLARLDRIERRVEIVDVPSPASAAPAARRPPSPSPPTPPAQPTPALSVAPVQPTDDVSPPSEPEADLGMPETSGAIGVELRPEHLPESTAVAPTPARRPPAPAPGPVETSSPSAVSAPAAGRTPPSGLDLVTVRRRWPEVLDEVKTLRRYTWTLLSHNAQVAGLEGSTLTLAMVNAGARDGFLRGGSDDIVREALVRVLGVDWKVEAIVDPSVGSPATGAGAGGSAPTTGASAPSGSTWSAAPPLETAPDPPTPEPAPAPSASPSPTPEESTAPPRAAPTTSARSARAAAQAAVTAQAPTAGPEGSPGPDDAPSIDDDDVDDGDLTHQDLLARELGAKVIGEYDAS